MIATKPPKEIIYPESDGQPLGENTLQVKWIIDLYTGFDLLFEKRPDVFLAADLFWYPVEGKRRIVTAPDLMIAFGRPKGDRPSYKQWEEEGIAPQVVFEVLSPGNRPAAMKEKLKFYEKYGVEEYYIFDPDFNALDAWVRKGSKLQEVPETAGFTSPRLGVRFEFRPKEPMRIIGPDGKPFMNHLEMRDRYEREIEKKQEEIRKSQAFAGKLRELGVDPDSL